MSAAKAWRIILPAFVFLLLLLLFLYQDTTLYLARIWSEWEDGSYSHGFVVLLLSGYIIYKKRKVLSLVDTCPALYAIPLVALNVVAWSLAGLANIQLLQAVILLPLVLSVILLLGGWQVTRKLLLPVLYIGLAIPVWSPLMPLLQTITAESAFSLARIAGIPAFMDDFTINLPAGRLSIEEACSGLHYLLAGVTLGVFYAWQNYRAFRHRFLVVALAIGASILANVLRVFIITWLAHRTAMQHPYVEDHLSLGWYLFAALVFLLLVVDLLLGRHADDDDAVRPGTKNVPCKYTHNWRYAIIFLATVLLAAGPLVTAWTGSNIVYRDLQALVLPAGRSGWQGPFAPGDEWRPQFQGAISQMAAYRRNGEAVLLYIAYYSRQQQGSELINELNQIANQDRWRRTDRAVTSIVPGGQTVIEEKLQSRDKGPRLVWYRYRVAGHYTSSRVTAKILEVAGMLAGHSGASVIAVATEINDDVPAARERLSGFLASMGEPLTATADGNKTTGGN
jgi:EpsI family protein